MDNSSQRATGDGRYLSGRQNRSRNGYFSEFARPIPFEDLPGMGGAWQKGVTSIEMAICFLFYWFFGVGGVIEKGFPEIRPEVGATFQEALTETETPISLLGWLGFENVLFNIRLQVGEIGRNA